MLKFVLLSLLLILTLSDNTVSISCGTCSSGTGTCLNLFGGGFNGYTYASLATSCSSQFGTYPHITTFTCSESQCETGCNIAVNSDNGIRTVFCSETTQGRSYTTALNVYYSAQEGSTDLVTYDWCGCGGLGVGAIVGIVLGSIAGLVLLVCLIQCCRRRKTSEEKELMMAVTL